MNRLLLPILFIFTGCASSGMLATCAHVSGSEMTVPYIGGKGSADAYVCHINCIGKKCPVPDYNAITQLTMEYLKNTGGKLTTSGPGTITFTPSK